MMNNKERQIIIEDIKATLDSISIDEMGNKYSNLETKVTTLFEHIIKIILDTLEHRKIKTKKELVDLRKVFIKVLENPPKQKSNKVKHLHQKSLLNKLWDRAIVNYSREYNGTYDKHKDSTPENRPFSLEDLIDLSCTLETFASSHGFNYEE